jgi:hypothetical protein
VKTKPAYLCVKILWTTERHKRVNKL